ncbi:ERCC4 domain-containing protein [Bisporella sp. PMI_857]|nr:ERCC4 domain-containing protein [Bisporella sp. PMI_857]
MPAEVINLLSSPEPGLSRSESPSDQYVQAAQNPKHSTSNIHFKPEPAKLDNIVWQILSSDDEETFPPPPPAPVSFTSGKRNRNQAFTSTGSVSSIATKPKQSTNVAKSDGGSLLLSDDIDITLNFDQSCIHASAEMKSTTNHTMKQTAISKSGNDFMFMPDEFDTNAHPDKPNTLPASSSSGLLGLDRKKMEEERLARLHKNKKEMVPGNHGVVRSAVVEKRKASVSPVRHFASDPFDFDESLRRVITSASPAQQAVSKDETFAIEIKGPKKKRKVSASPYQYSSDDPFTSPKQNRHSPKPVPRVSSFKRSASNIETSMKSASLKAGTSELARSKGTIVESDPILFTSSPDHIAEAAKRRRAKKPPALKEDDFSDPDGLERALRSKLIDNDMSTSDLSDDSLPDIRTMAPEVVARTSAKYVSSQSNITSKYIKTSKTSGRSHANEDRIKNGKDKELKAMERKRMAKIKAAEKEAEKERRRLEKIEKARQKDDAVVLAKANTLKTDKKLSTPEMIVYLPSILDEKLFRATQIFLEELSVEVHKYQSETPVIKWRRKADSIWDSEARIFKPCAPHLRDEKHIMYLISAKDFVKLATGSDGDDLDSHVLRLKTEFDDCKVIYMIEGMKAWTAKNKSVKNNGFTEAVRNLIADAEATDNQRRKRKEVEYVDEDVVEHALLKLQVMHGVLIHHSRVMNETSEWIRSFTQHISTIPYKQQQRSMDSSFCMESGQVQVGNGTEDTFIKMLEQMARITASIAKGIQAEYPTVQALVAGLREHGPNALADLRTAANNNGAFTDRRIGPAISKRVYNVFTSRDEGRDDV